MSTVMWPNRMNPTDALFWTMDKIPDLRSTIGALLLLERPVTRERIAAEYARLSIALPRMRQRVIEVPIGLAPPEWVDDPQFDLEYHLRYVAVPAPGGMAELLSELGPFYATALDPDRPLWEAYVADGLLDGRGAVFFKVHHCLVDGVGGSRLFAELLGAGAESRNPPEAWSPRERSTSAAALLWRALGYNAGEAIKAGGVAVQTLASSAIRPGATLNAARRWLRTAAGFGQELTVGRADSPLHHRRSLSRRLATFDMSLTEIDAARSGLNATNNDIVLTIVSGAMHRWHTSRGADVHELRALVPVSLRGSDEGQAGNRLALLAVSLPIGEPNPVRRLRRIQERMDRVKSDHRANMYPLMARVMIAMPRAVAEEIGRQQMSRTNFVCTNVPGPRHPCFLAGQRIERIYAYAPLIGDHPVAIALYSYRDLVCVGLDVDALAMDDLPHFVDALAESYAEVLALSREPGRKASRRRRRASAAA